MAVKYVYLLSGTSWFVPINWDNANNTIECWGGGGGGSSYTLGGAGGGGGAYASITNLTLSKGTAVSYVIGAGGTSDSSGGSTYFKYPSVSAAGGSSSGGAGGQASASIGTTRYSGGSGGSGGNAGGGGGGTGGSTGNGGNGSPANGFTGGSGGDGGQFGGAAGGAHDSPGNDAPLTVGGAGSGGGGGGGSTFSAGKSSYGNPGGNGGSYGGGGGGGGWYTTGGTGGNGAIKITYNTVAVSQFTKVVRYYTPGNYTYTVPSGTTSITVEVWGGGGGGSYALGSAASGGTSSFSGLLSATGGAGGNAFNAGTGGTGTGPITASGSIGDITANGYAVGGAAGGPHGGAGGNQSAGVIPGGGGGSGLGYTLGGGIGGSPQYYYAASGGGGGYASSVYSVAPSGANFSPGQQLSLTVGGAGAAYPGGYNGAPGQVSISYLASPSTVPSTNIRMSNIATAFNAIGDQPAAKPWYLSGSPVGGPVGGYAARNIRVGYMGLYDQWARTLRYGYGIQSIGVSGGATTYTGRIPTPGNLIRFSNFANTYQFMSMREPQFFNGAFDPPYQTYAQYDALIYYYTGTPQTFSFYNAKIIKIECWGANSWNSQIGAVGGYSVGVYVTGDGSDLYVYVGGAGGYRDDLYTVAGGWNGGGTGLNLTNYYCGAGGGATDVRTTYNANPLLGLGTRLIVAGGAGGSMNKYAGGNGGGANGLAGTTYSTAGGGGSNAGPGTKGADLFGSATPTAAGLGYGGSSNNQPVAGGGGGYYGGGAGSAAGGGSGYLSPSLLPATATGAYNFGVNPLNINPGATGYPASPAGSGNGVCLITILG